jgi:transposase-like protein
MWLIMYSNKKCPLCNSSCLVERVSKFGRYYRCTLCKNNISSKQVERYSLISTVLPKTQHI